MFRRPHTFYIEFPPLEGKYTIFYFVVLFTSLALHILFYFPPFIWFTAGTIGWMCRKGLEVHWFQTEPCNPLEEGLLLCFHVPESKQRRMPICSVSCMPWGTIQNTEENKGGVLSADDLMETCHHELCHLQLCADIWWCTKDYLGGEQWLERVKGCVYCERMFTVGEK